MFHPKGPTFWELARQALSSTERGYDLLAPKFDYTPFRTPDWLLKVVGDYLATVGPFDSALDACCGTGAAMRMVRPHCRRRVVGLDRSKGMLEEGQKLLADAPLSQPSPAEGGGKTAAPLEWVRGDALAMPFAAEFDLVVCFGAFGHILPKDESRFAAEVARVLRPGGRLVFITAYLPRKWSLQYWLARSFNAAMHVRNWLIDPPFIMYYLTFLLPEAQQLLERQGLQVELRELGLGRRLADYRLVIARRA